MASSHLQRAIENPTLELKVVSASGLSHVDATDEMDVYAVVSINDDKKQAAKTPIDYDGGPNPTWNHTIKLTVNEEAAREGLLTLKVELFSYWLEGKDDLYLGDVNVSVCELFASDPLPSFANGNVNKMKSLTCPIKVTEGGCTNARIILHRFGRPVYPHSDQTVTTKLILEIVIKLAKNIEDVNAFLAMDVYASVAICMDRKVKDRINTPVAFSANTNPKWNQKIKFLIDEKLGQEGRLMLLVELMSHRPLLGDKEIGSVRLPIQQLLSSNPPSSSASGDANGMKLETHALTGPYGKKGVVSFTYRFLAEQIRVATVTTSQPYIMYLPVKPHSNSSSDPVQVTSSYVAVQQGVVSGTSNGLVPIYMPPQYPSHEYQQYSPRKQQPRAQPQPPPQRSQVKPLPQQQFSQSLPDTQEA
uniref:C2 domain-containing protein n=1 Tax=Brassica campestris TaxID=3711 RepID=M4EXH1_BRACM